MRKVIYILLLLSFAFIPSVFAYDDSFDTYTLGDLNLQGNWTGSALFDVQNSVVHEGDNAVIIASLATSNIITTFDKSNDFTQNFSLRSNVVNAEVADVIFREGISEKLYINFGSCSVGNICYYTATIGSWQTIMAYNADTWYDISVIVNADDTFDIWVDNVEKVTGIVFTGDGIDTIKLNKRPFADIMYYDSFKSTLDVVVSTYFLTTTFLSPISSITLDSLSVSNNSLTEYNETDIVKIEAITSFHYFVFDGNNTYFHINPINLAMSVNHTVIAYPLDIPANNSGIAILIIGIVAVFIIIIVAKR